VSFVVHGFMKDHVRNSRAISVASRDIHLGSGHRAVPTRKTSALGEIVGAEMAMDHGVGWSLEHINQQLIRRKRSRTALRPLNVGLLIRADMTLVNHAVKQLLEPS